MAAGIPVVVIVGPKFAVGYYCWFCELEGDTVTFLAKTHREDSSSRERSSDRA